MSFHLHCIKKIVRMGRNINFSTISTDQYKALKDFEITYGFTQSKFGPSIIGTNNGKLCYTAFYDEGKENSAIDNLQSDWPKAVLKENSQVIKPIAEKIFGNKNPGAELDVLLKGTDWQINVWQELIKLKTGSTASYEQIAKAIGKPSAVRAVANAVAKNRVAYVIPCHRVIQKSGNIGKYQWGVQRKRNMLEYEKKA